MQIYEKALIHHEKKILVNFCSRTCYCIWSNENRVNTNHEKEEVTVTIHNDNLLHSTFST